MSAVSTSAAPAGVNLSRQVVRGVIEALETGRLAPGQRLVEADLCLRFGVSRNVVREALQRLESEGVVELSRHKGATVRERTLAEAIQIMELAELLNGLAARVAARAVAGGADPVAFSQAAADLAASAAELDPQPFLVARRAFYSTLLRLGAHRDLQRMYASLNIHVLRAQFDFTTVQRAYLEDFARIGAAVMAGDEAAAEQAAHIQVSRIRAALEARAATQKAQT